MLSLFLLGRIVKSGSSRLANWKVFQSAPLLSTMMGLLKVFQHYAYFPLLPAISANKEGWKLGGARKCNCRILLATLCALYLGGWEPQRTKFLLNWSDFWQMLGLEMNCLWMEEWFDLK